MPLPELELIRRIRSVAKRRGDRPGRAIGDDCAVLPIPRGHELLVTTDFSLEGVHFRRDWHPADSIGHRCLARGLSDIAAMGVIPRSAFLSLALPADLAQHWVDDFLRGLLQLAKKYDVQLAGGDTAQSPAGVLADIIVLGTAPTGKALLRSSARIGDILYVTGTLGASVTTLQELRRGKKFWPVTQPRHFYPDPRIAVGRFLREKKLATAMIDTSDGLSTDLHHICDESRVGATIEAAALPATPGDDGLQYALHGGEDYELLFTAPPNKRVPAKIAGVPIARIGAVTRGRQIRLRTPDGHSQPLPAAGWQHFA
ncbi:MAG TPA: thiamine-phosphate kinase [Candidatus Angelobacter sp.]|nr:thiamine-phosphate kinase [Candidatus Angelobacter sp.]